MTTTTPSITHLSASARLAELALRDADIASTVTRLLDIEVTDTGSRFCFNDLAGFAVRDNPKRAHLIVSKVLGKHIPVAPAEVLGTGYALAEACVEATSDVLAAETLVLGYCETATGLGHAVAERLGATYLHTTRRENPNLSVAAQFDEEHSHAVAHLIQPRPGVSMGGGGPLVLVDDELTTGKTVLNTIAALHAQFQRPSYVVATLLDARTPAGRAAFDEQAAAMGVTVRVASLLSAYLTLPEDVLDRAVDARHRLAPGAHAPAVRSAGPSVVMTYPTVWPHTVPTTARHGMTASDTAGLIDAARGVAEQVAPFVNPRGSVLVLGTEELLHAPTHVAARLAEILPDANVVNQSTTRSPVHASDADGYAIRRTLSFTAPDDPGRVSRVHNLVDPTAVPPVGATWADIRHTDVVIVVDTPVGSCTPMVEALRPFADTVHLVTVPSTLESVSS